MATGGSDDEPVNGRPLPPEDRVWRHPTEVALEHRHRRRTRRRQTALSVAGGMVVVVTVVVLGGDRNADPGVDAARTTLIAFDTTSTAAALGLARADDEGEDVGGEESEAVLSVRATAGREILAGALAVGDGFLITSSGAVAGHRDLVVVVGDRVEAAAVIGHDEHTDVSVIHVDADLVIAPVPDAPAPVAGEEVTLVGADGAPRSRAVVELVASAALRDGTALVGVIGLEGPLDGISPGTPALDEDGAVIGITAATADDAPAAVVPIELARGVAEEIIDHGAASHPVIGVTARDVNDSEAAGALVAAVDADGPAATGGIEVGDIIVAIDGSGVTSAAEMVATLRDHEPGDWIAIEVVRSDRHIDCAVELASVLDPAA